MQRTAIGRLRVRGAGADTPALRLGLTSLLATGDLQPPGLPPAAILVVRRLADPLPRRLPLRRRGVRLDTRWEQAARDAIAGRYRRAYRPITGDVPPDAEAVVFADEAEMLACLALDISHGRGTDRWWWKHLALGRAESSASLEVVLSERALHTPGAFALLVETGRLDDVVGALTPEAARRTLAAIAGACGCDGIAALTRAPVNPARGDAAHADRGADSRPLRQQASTALPADAGERPAPVLERPLVAPWVPIVGPIVNPALGPDRAALAGVVLAIQRRPAAVRSASFITSFAAWRAAARAESHEGTVPQAVRPHPVESIAAPAPEAQPPAAKTVRPAEPVLPHVSRPVVGLPPTAADFSDSGAPPDPVRDLHDTEPPAAVAAPVQSGTRDSVSTGLGGILYLINVMRALELPDCFEEDWRLASGAGGWGTLEAIAAGLLDAAFEAASSDSIWAVLARLGDRAPVAPIGEACREPPRFEYPAEWARQLAGEDLPLARPAMLAPAVSRRLAPACASWLAQALPFIRWRIARALALPPSDDALVAAALLGHQARVHVTRSHVDAVMSLDLISLPVRRAGLDRDPGWLPAFGRVVSFHFE